MKIYKYKYSLSTHASSRPFIHPPPRFAVRPESAAARLLLLLLLLVSCSCPCQHCAGSQSLSPSLCKMLLPLLLLFSLAIASRLEEEDADPVLYSQEDLYPLIISNSTFLQSKMAPAATHPHFRTVTQFKTDYSTSEITKYESLRTGMTAVVVDREGPKVHGFFAFATEIFDDSGAPHTLEHLCFMGSRGYPYKGILDRLATR
jgi:hypothetical protein